MEIRSGYARGASPDIEIHYEDLGSESNQPSCSSWAWARSGVVAQRVLRQARRRRLPNSIRFDNRDVGLSSKLHGQKVDGHLVPGLLRSFAGLQQVPVYRTEDMAADAAAVARSPRHRARAHRRGVDGRDDNPDLRRHLPAAHRVAGIIFSSNNSAGLPPPAPDQRCWP